MTTVRFPARKDPAQNRRYCKEWTVDTHRLGKLLVDPEPGAARVREWQEEGWSTRQIAAVTGVSSTRISALARGEYNRLHRDALARILAAQPTVEASSEATYVDATGTRRRIQAMCAFGYTFAEQGRALGITRAAVSLISGGQAHVHQATAAAVAVLYRDRSKHPGPSAAARSRAEREGWPGPLAWGADIDDPAVRPDLDDGEPVPDGAPLDRMEQLERAEVMTTRGATAKQIAAELGVTSRTVVRWRSANGWKAAH